MTTLLRQRLQWDGAAVHDGPRRYLLMRPDVLMGAALRLDGAARAALFDALAASTAQHGSDSLRAYAAQVGGDAAALLEATASAAADLGWGRWTLQRLDDALQLDVHDSPFAAGWRAAAGTDAPHSVCAPIRGMFTALAAQVQDAPVQVEETACAAQTDTGGICHFIARPTR